MPPSSVLVQVSNPGDPPVARITILKFVKTIKVEVKVKVQVNFILQPVMKAQNVSTGIAVFFL